MSKADEYKKVALEVLREYITSEDALIFEYSGDFEGSAAKLKDKAMRYLARLEEGEDTFDRLAEGTLLISGYCRKERSNGRKKYSGHTRQEQRGKR